MKKILLLSLLLFSTVFAQNIEPHCGVVFGAAVWRDDKPSNALYDRIVAGIDLYKKGEVNCLVLSGGASTYGAHEVDVMKRLVLESNIPESDLLTDYEGINTEATIRNLPETVKKYTFVSNDFHLKRIGVLARKLGIKDYKLYAASYNNGRYKKEGWFRFREIGGRMYAWVFVWK